MLALVFLVLAFGVGRAFVLRFFGRAIEDSLQATPTGRISSGCVVGPISFVAGTVILGWVAYLSALVSHKAASPLLYGNIAAFAVGLTVWATSVKRTRRDRSNTSFSALRPHKLEVWLGVVSLVVAAILMWRTLRIDGEQLIVGISVFSDFGPHLAVIRSFSWGENFPTSYPHFPDGTARYHFMFQFLAGNLEYLGLPLDFALNVPSALAFVSCCMLLYALAVVITGSRLAGVLAVAFFFFRSSFVWLDLLGKAPPSDWLKTVFTNDEFIGRTRHEDWGLWNQNIYVNQRHLAFSLGVLWFCLLLSWPLFAQMQRGLSSKSGVELKQRCRSFFATKDAWVPRSYGIPAAALGFILGASGFWNGAVLIAALMLLFGLAIGSKHRLDFLIIALVAGGLAFAQNRLFLGPNALAVAPRLNVGFLSEDPKSLVGLLKYFYLLLGLLPFAVLAAIVFLRKSRPPGLSLLVAIFLLPIVFAATIQLTPDVAINHKYVMIAVMLLNIVVAAWISALFRLRRWWSGGIALALTAMLVATGVVDAIALFNRNRLERALVMRLDDPQLLWAKEHARRREVFMTDWHSLHPLLLSGRSIFYGWPYYAWSAGYDTQAREEVVKQVYGSGDPALVRRLMKQHGMRFLVIDNGNREQKLYDLKEDVLRQNFPAVFASNDAVILQVDTPIESPQ